MPYVLGVDVGSSHTAAALCRLDESGWGAVEVVRLGSRSPAVPTVLRLAEDGSVLAGEAAQAVGRAGDRDLARGFSRRVGDDVPMIVGGQPYTAAALTAAMIVWVVQDVAAQQGADADHVVVTHPAGWGPYRRGELHRELVGYGLRRVTLLPEPVAAAENHARRDRVDSGDLLAVYSLGSGPVECSVVRQAEGGAFELLSSAESVDPVGGSTFDGALVDHVRAAVGRALTGLDPADPRTLATFARLARDCAEATKRLSAAPEATITVALPDGPARVRVERAEFEKLITPAVHASVDVLLRALRPIVGDADSGVAKPDESTVVTAAVVNPGPGTVVAIPPAQPGPSREVAGRRVKAGEHTPVTAGVSASAPSISAVLLVGGSVRVPLVAELVSAQLPARLAVEAEPEFSVAKGAALAACRMVPGRNRPLPALIERTSVLAPIVENAAQDQSHELDRHGWIPVPVEELDHRNDELAEPPPRPPVQITPLEVPERLLVKRLVHNFKERRSR